MPEKKNEWIYFTFGSEGQLFEAGYVKIKAETVAEAQKKFIARYGDKAWKGEYLNYAFPYDQEQFEYYDQFRSGPQSVCHEVIE